jgi:hypothetical protein
MAYSLKFSGATQVTEGENATVTVTRVGDLTKKVVVYLDSLNTWGVYPMDQQVSGGDVQNIGRPLQGGDGTGILTFDPGVARASVSIATVSDGVTEGREAMTIGYNVYEEVNGMLVSGGSGIDNSANPWPRDGQSTIGPWTIMVQDPGYQGSTPAAPTPVTPPVQTPSGPIPAIPGFVISGNNNWVNTGTSYYVDNSTTYIDNSVTNTYYTDNSVSYNNSFNTDNSVTSYSLSYLLNANDYSIGKTISGSGQLTGTDANDLLTGARKADSLTGGLGNDELIGGSGKDSLYGGLGSNVFNAGSSGSKSDADRLYIQRENNASSADIIEAIGKSDRIYIQGATGDLNVREVNGGLGIFDNGLLQAVYTGNAFTANTLDNLLVSA